MTETFNSGFTLKVKTPPSSEGLFLEDVRYSLYNPNCFVISLLSS